MGLNNSRQDVREEDTADTWAGQRFLWLLQGRGRGCAVFILPYCVPSCKQSKRQGQALSFLRRQLWLSGCVCVCARESVRVRVCLSVCFLAKANSDGKSGTLKKTLVLYPPLRNLRLGSEKNIKQTTFFSKVL